MNEQIIPSTYSGYSISEEYNSPHTIYNIKNNYLLGFKILPISMYYYAKNHIPNYNTITTYPNDPEYNPNTTGTTDFRYAFANMKYCKDTIGSIMNRFNWNSCTTMYNTFYNCYNITGSIPYIPNNVTNISYVFSNCYNITGYIPTIPNSIRYMNGTFYDCFNLTGSIPNIPNSISDISYAFYYCSNLTGSIPNIPNSVTNMNWTFANCSNLTGTIPNIPNSVTDMYSSFKNCSNLSSSNVYIHSNNISFATNCFYGMGNTITIYIHYYTKTYNTFYKAMGNSTYNAEWNCYLKTF